MKPFQVLLLTALILTFLIPGGMIAKELLARQGAEEWTIPIAGFDPRDPFRGHYLTFRFDWMWSANPGECEEGKNCALCLNDGPEGNPVVSYRQEGDTCRSVVPVTETREWSCEIEGETITHRRARGELSRAFIAESRSHELNNRLREGKDVIALDISIDDDGKMFINGKPRTLSGPQSKAMLAYRAAHPPCPRNPD